MKITPKFTLNKLSLAVASAVLFSASASAEVNTVNNNQKEKDPEYFPVERIQVTGRLRTSASAAVEERREQIAVGDILGLEQLSRTGDSSAAAALRRVTGLTLKDGKFIYVRGLGERYSSTSLNGAIVPSPDPTRNVVPLDMFPASIIESLSVQKSASADRPAAFGGGHVDIRTLSTPVEPFVKVSLGTSFNTNDSNDALSYNGGGDAWKGKDDGTRALANTIVNANNQYGGISPIDIVTGSNGGVDFASASQINRDLATDLYRDMNVTSESTDQPLNGNLAFGTNWDIGDEGLLGIVAAFAYKNEQSNYEKKDIELDGDATQTQVENDKRVTGTDTKVKFSAMFNMGFELNDNHKIESFSTYLSDSSDDVSVAIEETIDTLGEPNALQVYDIDFQQRTLMSNQLKGTHYFEDYWELELKWQYTDSKSSRKAPSELSYTYNVVLDDANAITSRNLNTQDAPKYVYSQLDDDLENFGFDLGLPVAFDNTVVTFKGGYQYTERSRTSYATRLGLDVGLRPTDANGDILAKEFYQIFSDENIASDVLDLELKDASTDTEDYIAAEKNDAVYVSAEFDFDDELIFYAGIRYEDFRRVTLPLEPDGNISDEGGRYQIEDYIVQEDGFFPSLSMTYKEDDLSQWRVALSKTMVRPDLREVSPVRFQDPVTGFDFFGNPNLKSSAIYNLDTRWEYYSETGDNYSIGAFYKDIDAPIEPIQRISEAGRQLKFYNANSGFIYGIEAEALQGLAFLGDAKSVWQQFFIAANITLSDSEIEIAQSGEIDPTNTKRRMTGHSEWVTNFQISFDSKDEAHNATIVYNVFGDRIAYGGRGGLDDVYEQPFHSLDFTYKYYPIEDMSISFKAKNLLDEKTTYDQQDIEVYSKEPGSKYSIQVSYKF